MKRKIKKLEIYKSLHDSINYYRKSESQTKIMEIIDILILHLR